MMDFKEFVKEVADKIKEFLPDAYVEAEVSIKDVTKNNGVKLTGLTIRNENSNISPTIYMESFYEKYSDQGVDFNTIMQEIANARVEHEVKQEFDATCITDFEKVRDKIVCKLVNRDLNTEYLENRPYTPVEDLAVIYMIDLGWNGTGHMTTGITDKLMETYGITTQELHGIAMDNLSRSDISFRSMWETLMGLNSALAAFDSEDVRVEMDKSPMYTLMINDSNFGAAAVLDKATMDDIAERLGGDYVVIPSSVCEVIIVPYSEAMTISEMNAMVQDVNATELDPQDRLSDHVYLYDSVEHELVSPEKYEERYSEKSEDHDVVSEITSIKDKLSDKTAEVAKNEAVREHPVKTKDTPVLA